MLVWIICVIDLSTCSETFHSEHLILLMVPQGARDVPLHPGPRCVDGRRDASCACACACEWRVCTARHLLAVRTRPY